MTTQECFEEYDRRFARAMATRPAREPWRSEGRAEIVRVAKACLGMRDEWQPEIRADVVRVSDHAGFRLEHLHFVSEAAPDLPGAK